MHNYVKAFGAQSRITTQFIEEKTLSESMDCEKRWWLSLALFVKAQRLPWSLTNLNYDTTYAGIGFSIDQRKAKGEQLVIGCSHLYNNQGHGLKYKLRQVENPLWIDRKNPYLSENEAYKFGLSILDLFHESMERFPKRVVIHKRTPFQPTEINGLRKSLAMGGVTEIDLISITEEANIKAVSQIANSYGIYTDGYPLKRGVCIQISNQEIGRFDVTEKAKPVISAATDAVVKVTMSSICTSDLHIKHGSVPRAVPGITVGHEMVGVVESVGDAVTKVRPGDRVAVNVETFCGECFFCRHGWVNNCTDPNGGWALGCRIDGGQTEFVRVPFADNGLTVIPDNVSDEQALFVGDILATGYWAAKISEIGQGDTVLIIGAGPTGLCTLQCVRLYNPKRIIVCEKDAARQDFVKRHYPDVVIVSPEDCLTGTLQLSEHGGADRVIEVAGAEDTFQLAWQAARPNAIVTVVALYDQPQVLPLPDMYGKNLTFKTGGVDGCDCGEILRLISEGKIDTTPLITHTFPFSQIEEAYNLFENRRDNVIKVAITSN